MFITIHCDYNSLGINFHLVYENKIRNIPHHREGFRHKFSPIKLINNELLLIKILGGAETGINRFFII